MQAVLGNTSLLGHFIPVEADASGLIGEDSCGIPNNLMLYVLKAAAGMQESLNFLALIALPP